MFISKNINMLKGSYSKNEYRVFKFFKIKKNRYIHINEFAILDKINKKIFLLYFYKRFLKIIFFF